MGIGKYHNLFQRQGKTKVQREKGLAKGFRELMQRREYGAGLLALSSASGLQHNE